MRDSLGIRSHGERRGNTRNEASGDVAAADGRCRKRETKGEEHESFLGSRSGQWQFRRDRFPEKGGD
ncbi:hypothetical protein MRX96_013922 [Rhipicephalus microplus]